MNLIFLALLCLAQAVAQTDKNSTTPALSNVREAQSPAISPDRSLHFTLKAPEAKSVQVSGGDGLGKGPFPMTKNSDGIWSVTTPPAVPGFHYYWFVVDGVQVNDPGSETYFGYNKETSGIEVPESGTTFYDVKDVPHGEVRMKWYFSKTTAKWRRALVYTPPGYDGTTTKYPVLILQHGSGENETGWTKQGRANFILDNLLAEGRVKPMIVVMDWGYANKAAAPSDYTSFESVIVNDLIPAIDASYRTLPDKQHRAMAGLSMGGSQTLFIALHNLDKFAYVASFSGRITGGTSPTFQAKTAYNAVFADVPAFNKQVKLLWLGAGTEEKQLHDSMKNAADTLKTSGINTAFYASPGTAHEWQTWRRALQDFAPKLFQ